MVGQLLVSICVALFAEGALGLQISKSYITEENVKISYSLHKERAKEKGLVEAEEPDEEAQIENPETGNVLQKALEDLLANEYTDEQGVRHKGGISAASDIISKKLGGEDFGEENGSEKENQQEREEREARELGELEEVGPAIPGFWSGDPLQFPNVRDQPVECGRQVKELHKFSACDPQGVLTLRELQMLDSALLEYDHLNIPNCKDKAKFPDCHSTLLLVVHKVPENYKTPSDFIDAILKQWNWKTKDDKRLEGSGVAFLYAEEPPTLAISWSVELEPFLNERVRKAVTSKFKRDLLRKWSGASPVVGSIQRALHIFFMHASDQISPPRTSAQLLVLVSCGSIVFFCYVAMALASAIHHMNIKPEVHQENRPDIYNENLDQHASLRRRVRTTNFTQRV